MKTLKQLFGLVLLLVALACFGAEVTDRTEGLPEESVEIVLTENLKEGNPRTFHSETSRVLASKNSLDPIKAMLVGEWVLAIEGGNEEFYELPKYIFLKPFSNRAIRGIASYEMEPMFPKKHIFGGECFWQLKENGTLMLEWSTYSGVRVFLENKGNSRWEGTASAFWDFSLPGFDAEPNPERKAILQRVPGSG